MEFSKSTEQIHQTQKEGLPSTFPVVTDNKERQFGHTPPLQTEVIVHFIEEDYESTDRKNRYTLLSNVAGYNYIFQLGETSTKGKYVFTIKTEEYELATVNLDEEGYLELAQKINAFLESVHLHKNSVIHEILISPASTSYTVVDVERCIEEIIKSPQNSLTREELMKKYPGYLIFNLYLELFNKIYEENTSPNSNRAKARARFFKTMFRKHLPNWEIDDDEFTNDFKLVRRSAEMKE